MLILTKADWNIMTWEEATSTPLNAYRGSKYFSVSSVSTAGFDYHADHFIIN